MLAGRRDAAFLDNFVRDFGARFAEPDGTVHDAYGHRWRCAFGFDQLDAVVAQLSDTPGSRQAVISMWDTTPCYDEGSCQGEEDLRGTWRTRPCNLNVMLRIRQEGGELKPADGSQWEHEDILDITVCCRSNDIVWGAYGANAVHFSVLQEYLAARLDVGVGTYIQFSQNYHCYRDQWKRLATTVDHGDIPRPALSDDRYTIAGLVPQPLVHDTESFDAEVGKLLRWYETGRRDLEGVTYDRNRGLEAVWAEHDFEFHNPFLSKTVWPMLMTHHYWRQKNYHEALAWCDEVEAHDWESAAREWVVRRMK